MSNSQSNESRETLNRISSYILGEQNIDIGLLTSGHLNERHLWKPPEMRTHQPWETSKTTKSQQPVPRLPLDEEKLYSLPSPRKQLFKLDQNQKVEVLGSTTTTTRTPRDEPLKLPSIRDSPRLSSQTSPKLDFLNCITDKELAIKILTGPITGFSKEEKFKAMSKIENEVVKKKDLTISNVLHSTQSNDYLESKLNQELSKLDPTSQDNTLARLSLFSNVFQELIENSSAFRDILRRIKYEYDDYLFYLLKEPELDPGLLNEQLELTEEYRAVSRSKIKKLDMEIEELEKLIEDHLKQSGNLEAKIREEEEFYMEKSERKKELDHYSSRYDNRSMKKQTLGDKIDKTRVQVLAKIQELKLINEKLKSDYLPAVVITNLKKTIKDIEIETLKIDEQNKYLLTEEAEAENELRALLLQHDHTEFASDNVEYLIKFVKNMNLLSMDNNNNSSKSSAPSATTTTTTTTSDMTSEFNHKYDDYFS